MSDGALRFLRLPPRAWSELTDVYAPDRFRFVVDSTRFTRTWRVALVVVESELVGTAVLRRYGRPGSGQDGLEFVAAEAFQSRCPWSQLVSAVTERSRVYVDREDGDPLPPMASQAVEATLGRLVPGAREILARARLALPGRASMGSRASLLREQRDAIALGLEIAGLESRDLLGGDDDDIVTRDDSELPFLSGWNQRRVSEPATVRHDSTAFDGWLRSEASHFDTATFRDPRDPARRVTVFYADKEALEHQTGTDLLYYRHHRHGFILVQYKRMRVPAGGGSLAAYFPDPQLHAEIDRYRSLPRPEGATSVTDWRLTDDAYFVKLVRDDVKKPMENKLVFGMYLPIGLVDLLLKEADEGRRPRGWSTRSVSTYMSNAEFLLLAKQGYLGTRGHTTEHLKRIITGSFEDGRGVVLAVDQSDPNETTRLRHG